MTETCRSARSEHCQHFHRGGFCCDCGLTLNTETRESRADRLKRESGKSIHSSDCATSIAPAEEPGPCDCKGDTEAA